MSGRSDAQIRRSPPSPPHQLPVNFPYRGCRITAMMKRSAWLHLSLTLYIWLISWIPLGNWNRQREGTLLQALLGGRGIQAEDLGMLVFVTLPGVLFWLAYKRGSFWVALPALTLDAVWLVMQIQSWWLPYIFGTDRSEEHTSELQTRQYIV